MFGRCASAVEEGACRATYLTAWLAESKCDQINDIKFRELIMLCGLNSQS